MTQAIQKFEQPKLSTPDVNEFGVMKETSSMLVKTGFLPQAIKTPEQAIAIILTGRELGIGTMAALNTINVIQGKPTVSPQLMLALIERSGQLADIQIEPHDGNAVRCTMKRKGRSPHTEIFGDAEAQAMQLAGKDNYKKQAQTMYRWRAVAACARVVFPDVILGLYTPDEMGADVTDEGEILPPVKNNLRQIAPNTVDGEIVEDAKPLTVSEICKQLKAAGDEVDWNQTTLAEYASELFGTEYTALRDLSDEQKTFLTEDLGERLKQFQTK
jgi:hypothetical protein